MVDALKKIHGLLQSEGRLVDIHPATRPPPVTIRSATRTAPVGLLQEHGDFVDYELAEAALRDVVDAGLFRWESKGGFDQCVVADSPEDLFTHLETKWKRAIVDADLQRAIERDWPHAEPGSELVISQPVCIWTLRPIAFEMDL